MKKVLHVNSSISSNSGVMNVIMNYYRHIDRKKIQFDFLYYIEHENNYKKELDKLGSYYYLISSPKNILKFKDELSSFLVQHFGEYEIVHLHDIFLARIMYKIFKDHGIKKVIVHCHSAKWSNNLLSGIRNKLMCINLNKYADDFFACSRAAGNFVYKKDMEYTIVNNAIEIDRFVYSVQQRKKLRAEMKLDNKIVIGHVGRFSKEKNHKFLIEVFEEILKINKNSVLLLIGEGDLKEKIELNIKELDLENKVILLGNRKDVNLLYQVMDVFILPSIYEGLPLVGVEAQISGLRCVMSDVITNEVNLTDVSFLSLKTTKKDWAVKILEKANEGRIINSADMVKEKEFSICQEAEKLQKLYLNMLYDK